MSKLEYHFKATPTSSDDMYAQIEILTIAWDRIICLRYTDGRNK